MYSTAPGQVQEFIDQDKEDYLLGKRKIDVKTIVGEVSSSFFLLSYFLGRLCRS
jgi:hypothetical protein